MSICMYVCWPYICNSVCLHACMYLYRSAYLLIYMYACMHDVHLYVRTPVFTAVCIHTYVHTAYVDKINYYAHVVFVNLSMAPFPRAYNVFSARFYS